MLFGKNSQNILSAAKAKFFEKDFNSTSLRNIVKTAGVTTSAFYGYFSGKEPFVQSPKSLY